MSERLNLENAERKVFRATLDDGLWDIIIAGVALELAVAPLLSRMLGDFWSSAVFVPFLGVLFLAIWLTHKYVVKPRAGAVKLGRRRIRRLMRFTVVMVVVNTLALILGLTGAFYFDALSGQTHNIIFSVVFLIGFSLAAYYLDYPRLYVYGFLFGIAPHVGEWLWSSLGASHHGFPITFGTVSGVVFLTGLMTFVRFLGSNPRAADTDAEEQ